MGENVTSRNLRHSRTGFRDESGTWYALDNAGTIMPAVSNSTVTSLFRISATLDEVVNLSALQSALDRTAARFPYFTVELRRGAFWYYFEPHRGGVTVEADGESPSQDYDIKRKGACLYRVRAQGRRVACEFSHALTDGTGGLRFLKNLLSEYFRLRAESVGYAAAAAPANTDPDIYDPDAPPDHEEYEDAYQRYFPGDYPRPGKLPRAFHIASEQLPRHEYRITSGVIPLAPALELSRSLGVSLTELLAAAFLDALQSLWLSYPAHSRKRSLLAVEIPVNMRKFHPTKTNRNFSLFVLATKDMRLGPREFTEMAHRAHYQLRMENDARMIGRQIARNVAGTRNLFVRLVPLWIKDFFAKMLFSSLGDDLLSGFVSNLGSVSLPPGVAEHVERMDFLPAPSAFNKTSASVLSWRGVLYINFGSLAVSRDLERFFFTRLRRLGMPVRVECNLEVD